MSRFDEIERLAQVEKTILNHGIHIAAKDLLDAMKNVEGDAKHGIDGFEGTLAHQLMLRQLEVLKEAYAKITKLRTAA